MEELANQIENLTDEQVEELNSLLVTRNVGGSCPIGQHWDNVLKKCVLDEG